jgi:hypothetical protein
MTRVPVRRVAPVVVTIVCAVYVPRLLPQSAELSERLLPTSVVDTVGPLVRLACLAVAAVFGLRSAARLERDNPARGPWFLLGAWLALFTLGQVGLVYYPLVARAPAPLPSIADAAFLLGYALLIAASVRFVFVYRASGFPVGSAREHLGIAAGAAAAMAVVGYPLLAPIARAPVPLGERLINIAYPILDLIALVPALVMLRIARAFRGGKVWAIWGSLLAGCALMAVGDILFAFFSSAKVTAFGPGVDMMLLLGYFAAACGTMLQYETITD